MAGYLSGRIDISPEEARYNPEKIIKLAEAYENLVNAGRLQAAGFLMARGGKIFAHQMTGKLTYKPDSPPARPDSIKWIASITKVFTAGIIMKLVEDGVLWLEQPVKTVIPEFDTPLHGGIQLRHLLTHTSGLAADSGYFSEPYPMPDDFYQTRDWIKRILSGPMQARPGEQWNYCSKGFVALAEIAQRVTGRHLHDLASEMIFKPLGMERSFFEIPDSLADEWIVCDDWDYKGLAEAKKRDPKRPNRGSGGMYSTMYDLFRYGQCFLNRGELDGVRFLGKTTVDAMTRNQIGDWVTAFHWGKNLRKVRQGFGWEFFTDGSILSDAAYNHEGWGWCSLFVDPSEEIIFISFTAAYSGWDPDIMVKPRTIAWSGIL